MKQSRMSLCRLLILVLVVCHASTAVRGGIHLPFHPRTPTPALPEDDALLKRHAGAGAHTPEQVRVSYAGPGAVTIAWVTWPQEDRSTTMVVRKLFMVEEQNKHRSRVCDDIKDMRLKPTVQWGYTSGSLVHEERGEYTCYTTVAYDSGALHHATLGARGGPLRPGSVVYYRVGDPEKDVWSEELQFKMAPEIGPKSLPYRLGLIGDLGQTKHSVETLDHINANNPDSVMFVGDMSYADGYHPRWDTWGRMVSEHTSRLVWMYTEGNHEIEPAHSKDTPDFLAYLTRFKMPYKHSGSESQLYYSYNVAGAHIIMLGSYAEYGEDSAQYAWLENDLRKVDRRITPWVIVGMHAPWYNSNHNHYGEGEEMRKIMEPLLYQYGVDFVVSGHVHAYERSEHVYDNKLDKCGPMYLNVGDGGNREGLDFDYFKQPDWSAVREPSYGHGILDLVDETHARFVWHRNQDGAQVADSASITRNPNCRSVGMKKA
mmetsp:Transcript_299/g.698  ORF Transcript_299/g.698 Transcript_299/m.698 type:complete len:486 (-) Transcript_299:98-1555(-)